MTVARYYIAPWQALFAIGGGQFSETDPGGARPTNGSRVLLYGTWQRDITGHYCETKKAYSARGRAKDMCMSYVAAPDVDPLGLHAAIQADAQISLVPWTPDNLDDAFSTLTAQQQTQVQNALESVFMDSQWITPARTFRDIISYMLHVLFGCVVLGADYPEGPLNSRWNGLSAQQQASVRAFLVQFNLPTVSGNPQLRSVVNLIAQADYGSTGPTLGGVLFRIWLP